MHLFSYLACVLGLFRKRPVSDWGYGFASTNTAAPFSREVADATTFLVDKGYATIEGNTQLYTLTKFGRNMVSTYLQLREMRERHEFLAAACNTTVLLPIGHVRVALKQDERTRFRLGCNRMLLDASDSRDLYEVFRLIGRKLGFEPESLDRPALVWLGSILQSISPEEYSFGKAGHAAN